MTSHYTNTSDLLEKFADAWAQCFVHAQHHRIFCYITLTPISGLPPLRASPTSPPSASTSPLLPHRLLQKPPHRLHPRQVLALRRHRHPEGAREARFLRQHAGRDGVAVGHEGGQHGQAGAGAHGFVLGGDAGAAKGKALGRVALIEKLQLFGEQQVVRIADEGVVAQVFALGQRYRLTQSTSSESLLTADFQPNNSLCVPRRLKMMISMSLSSGCGSTR